MSKTAKASAKTTTSAKKDKEAISAKVASTIQTEQVPIETTDAVETILLGMRSKLVELKQNVDDYSKTLKELEKAYQVIKRKNKKKVRCEKEGEASESFEGTC